MADQRYVYESPDGGHTVYRRQVCGNLSTRELHSISQEKRKWDLSVEREMRWTKIVATADQDPVLKEMLDQIETYYNLKHAKD